MDVMDFQSYLEANVASSVVNVDLLELAGSNPATAGYPYYRGKPYKLRLVVDAENCLDRLYGGYFTDWICGGQWNRMVDYLSNLAGTCRKHGIQLVVYFDGTMDSNRTSEWAASQLAQRKKVTNIFRHIANKSTPPPKVWWSPPVGLITALKFALRQQGIRIATSVEDHHLEVIHFLREHDFQGLVAQSAVYALTMFDSPRYFSAQSLKLSYQGSLETKEFIMDEVAKQIDLNPDRFSVLAALLGNQILSSDKLQPFYKNLLSEEKETRDEEEKSSAQNASQKLISAVITFVRDLETVEDLSKIAGVVFQDETSEKEEKVKLFKDCVDYYVKGTAAGYVKKGKKKGVWKGSKKQVVDAGGDADHGDTDRLELEASEEHLKHESGYSENAEPTEGGDAEETTDLPNGAIENEAEAASNDKTGSEDKQQSQPDGSSEQADEAGNGVLPFIPADVLRTTRERHAKGMMSPWVLHVLTKREVRIPVSMENEQDTDLPLSIDLYRPMRANAYAVMFSIKPYRKKKNGEEPPPQPEVDIKEVSVVRPTAGGVTVDVVRATPLDWLTPSLKRLWLGQQIEDRNRRLRAFLSCLRSDSPMLLNTGFVPQPLLLACCVLRYMLQHKQSRVLRKHELDAFLATMASPHLHDSHFSQDIQLPLVSPRAVQLASLFMSGLEHAVFVNDVCGAPLPWGMCCPWLCFNGKLLHHKLLKSSKPNMTPIELCDGQMDQLMLVESMRQAVLEGLSVEFAKVPLPLQLPAFQQPRPHVRPPYPGFNPAGNFSRPPSMRSRGGRGRGMMGPRGNTGGQLEVAGTVVGSWGPNAGPRPQPPLQHAHPSHEQYEQPMPSYPPPNFREGAPSTSSGVGRIPVTSMKTGIRGKTSYRGTAPRGGATRQAYASRPSPRQGYDSMPPRITRNLTVDAVDTRGLSPPMAFGASMSGAGLSVPHVSTSYGLSGMSVPSTNNYASAISPQGLENAVAQMAATQFMDPTVGMMHVDSNAVQMQSFLMSGASGSNLGTSLGTSLQNMHGSS